MKFQFEQAGTENAFGSLAVTSNLPIMSNQKNDFLCSGQFRVGCNYWASHAGAHMWGDWSLEVVEKDLNLLAAEGLKLIRVFPLWPDFQPLSRLDTAEGDFFEYRHGEASLPTDEMGSAGISALMMDRFRMLADVAQRNGIQLIVGLITGWMSGRLFAPPAFAGVNVITDREALRWQARFVSCFVRQFRSHSAIVAWDLGNECNVMGRATGPEAWIWTHTLSAGIRAEDASRPVVSGMHALEASPKKPWSIHDQAELTDFLTTHPYPLWTRLCDSDPITTLRPQIHATVESLFYSGIGGKPCFAEELGSMGPFIAADEYAVQFLRPSLYSLWAHDCRSMLWWCAFDQNHLTKAPYDWLAVERHLGLFTSEAKPKRHVAVLREFVETIEGLPLKKLPPRLVDAVCLLTEGQDQWAVAQGAFNLAKFASADLSFHWMQHSIPDSEVYFLPCLSGLHAFRNERWQQLLNRIRNGATLYVSFDAPLLGDLEPVFGVDVVARERRARSSRVQIGDESFLTAGEFKLSIKPTRAVVHGREDDGTPAFIECVYGNGRVFLLTHGIEAAVGKTLEPFSTLNFGSAWRVYERVFQSQSRHRVWRKTNLKVFVTEHIVDERTRLVILVNHSESAVIERVQPAHGWKLHDVLKGGPASDASVVIPRAQVAILRLTTNA